MRLRTKKRLPTIAAAILFSCLCPTNLAAQTKTAAVDAQIVERLTSEAADAVQAADFTRAKIVLQRLLKAAPRDAAANTLAGIVAERADDLPAAEKHFARAARAAPNAPETRNNYGAILVRLGRRKEAAAEFAASLAANPKQSSALVNLAQIRLAEGNTKTARELFERAKLLVPDQEIRRALVLISLKSGERERAVAEYAEYAAAPPTEAVAPNETRHNARAAFAEALLAGGLLEPARQESEFILADDQRNAAALVLLSKIHLQRRDIRAAGRLLETAVAEGLDDARVYLALAEVYEAGGYPENAIPAMRRAVEKEPKNDFYRSRYGLLLVNTKAPAAALIRLEEALKEFPDSPSLWFALGIAQFDDNKISEAGKSFERALKIDAKLIPALAYMGAVFVEQARYADAVKIYERAVGLNPNVALLHYLLGDTLLKMTDADDRRIEAALKRAAEIDPDLTSAHVALGRLYVRQARWTEAAVFFERAAKLEPDRGETFYQLARVYARLKRAAESKTALERFKRLNDSQKEQKETNRRELVRRLADVRF